MKKYIWIVAFLLIPNLGHCIYFMVPAPIGAGPVTASGRGAVTNWSDIVKSYTDAGFKNPQVDEDQITLTYPDISIVPSVTIPTFRFTCSANPASLVDTYIVTSVGGGLTFEQLSLTINKQTLQKTKYAIWSWSLPSILVDGQLKTGTNLNLSVATTVGAFDNLLMIGVGYNLGVQDTPSRWFGLLSIGVNVIK